MDMTAPQYICLNDSSYTGITGRTGSFTGVYGSGSAANILEATADSVDFTQFR